MIPGIIWQQTFRAHVGVTQMMCLISGMLSRYTRSMIEKKKSVFTVYPVVKSLCHEGHILQILLGVSKDR